MHISRAGYCSLSETAALTLTAAETQNSRPVHVEDKTVSATAVFSVPFSFPMHVNEWQIDASTR